MKIIIFGPNLKNKTSAYGGGQGGIVSAISRMLACFNKHKINFIYTEYSTRSLGRLWFLLLPYRFFKDIVNLGRVCAVSGDHKIVHLVADGGLSVYRTLAAIWLIKIFSKKVVCDVRGNALEKTAVNSESLLIKLIWYYIIRRSSAVLVQSSRVSMLLHQKFKDKIIHYPNWIDTNDALPRFKSVLSSCLIDVIFIGYCYRGKGVFDAVNGCIAASKEGVNLRLTLIGEEDQDFTSFCDTIIGSSNLQIRRLGRLPKSSILKHLFESDVFLFPSYHPGEGHPNVINEAMLAKLVIVTTEAGAVSEILDKSMALFIKKNSHADISEKLIFVNSNREISSNMGLNAHNHLLLNYSADLVFDNLLNLYKKLISKCVA